MGAKERIKEYCRASGIKISAFEKQIGATNGYVNSISKWVGPEYERAILENFPNLNLEWAKTGAGSMFADEKPELPSRGAKLIPLLPFSAVAGWMVDNNGVGAFGGETIMFTDFSERGADCAIRVEGNSMWPRYNNGDVLAIRIVKDPSFYQWGRVYVVSTSQGCIVKRLFPDPDDDNKIICHSENSQEFPDYKIDKSDVLAVAIVVGHAGIE